MNSAPILAARLIVQAHLGLALIALLSGTFVIFSTKGTRLHRRMGWIFSAAMLAAAALSFGLTSITPGRYSAIHLLSVLTLATIPLGIWRRRHGDIRGHAIAMASNYIGLVIAGAFALTAPRLLHTAFFAL